MAESEYVFPPAEASPQEVLDVEPNKAVDATEGPHETPSATTYVTWTRPDGTSTVAPISNSETYERKGFSKGAEFEMESIVAWNQENAAKEPPKPAEASAQPSEEKPAESS